VCNLLFLMICVVVVLKCC